MYKRLPRSLAEEEGAEGEAGRTKRRGTNSAGKKQKKGGKGRVEVRAWAGEKRPGTRLFFASQD